MAERSSWSDDGAGDQRLVISAGDQRLVGGGAVTMEGEVGVGLTFSHVGICVGDLERALRFYCEGLGFELVQSHTVGQEFGRLMEIDDVALQSRFVRRDGVSIELLHFDAPGHVGEAVRRPMNQLGLTHVSLRVSDVDAVAERIESWGGTVVRSTRTTFGSAGSTGSAGPAGSAGSTGSVGSARSADVLDFVYCTDPDGTRIELMHLPG